MRMRSHRSGVNCLQFRLPALGVAAAVTLSGCVFHHHIAKRSRDFNLAVETAQHQMLFLNIIRAKLRRPMYFTAISELAGDMRVSASTGGVTIPLGPDAADDYSLSPRADWGDNPSFNVAVLDSQEFMRGILAPVELRVLDYYWQQGWQPELLLSLLVERIDRHVLMEGEAVNKEGDKKDSEDDWEVVSIINEPSGKAFSRFVQEIETLIACGLRISRQASAAGPLIPEGKLRSVGDQISVAKESMNLERIEVDDSGKAPDCDPQTEGESCYQLLRPQLELSLVLDPPPSQTREGIRESEKSTVTCPKAVTPERQPAYFGSPPAADPKTVKTFWVFYPRSPQGVLFYLGEIMRAENPGDGDKAFVPMIQVSCKAGKCRTPLFFATTYGKCPETPVVSTVYGGERWVIPESSPDPACDGGRSMQTLTLVSQLLALQKSSEELPGAGFVRILGQ